MLRQPRRKVLSDPELKKRADNPTIPRLQYMSILPSVKPLDSIDFRQGDHVRSRPGRLQTYGSEFAGGALASTLMPPSVEGHEKFDLYPNGADHKETSTRQEHPDRVRAAEQLLHRWRTGPTGREGRCGVGPAVAGAGRHQAEALRPSGDYFSQYAGNPPYMRKNGIDFSHEQLGRGLERRLRLPVADRRRPGDPGDRRLVEPEQQYPRGQPAARHGGRRDPTRASAIRCTATSTSA